jgi:hypothetical protein
MERDREERWTFETIQEHADDFMTRQSRARSLSSCPGWLFRSKREERKADACDTKRGK